MPESHPAPDRHAVFLSYASQDAAAARRICDTLRAGGIAVWYDEEELRGGDAWDAKIRQQIRECALFLPIISANTQARLEGYFRLEWRLAEQRTHLMAKGRAFLLPVTVDDTRAERAQVPDAFLDVQWTAAPGGVSPAGFAERVRLLLANPALDGRGPGQTSLPPAAEKGDSGAGQVLGSANLGRRSRPLLFPGVLVLVVLAAIAGAVAVHRSSRLAPATAAGAPPANVAPTAAVAAANELPVQARQLADRAFQTATKLNFERDDLTVAEDQARRATEIDSGSARAWGVLAWVEASYINRNWDSRPARQEAAQGYAHRALAIDQNEPAALGALARVLIAQGAPAAAVDQARKAVASSSGDPESQMVLATALNKSGRRDESIVILQETIRSNPGNVLVRYVLANTYGDVPPAGGGPYAIDEDLAQLAEIARIHPFASAYVNQAIAYGCWKGDLGQMRKALDQLDALSLADRTDEKALFIAVWGALAERRPQKALDELALSAVSYFQVDTSAGRPKAWLSALAQREAGHATLALAEWKAAEPVLRQRLHDDPQRQEIYSTQLATTLAWLGRTAEASDLITPLRAAADEQLTTSRGYLLAQYFAALGDAANAVPYLRKVINHDAGTAWANLQFDPGWDKLRGNPEFETLLAENRLSPKPKSADAGKPSGS